MVTETHSDAEVTTVSGGTVGEQQNLALKIFSAFSQAELPLAQVGHDFTLRKASMLVDVSSLGLVARRAVNVCYFLAQGAPEQESYIYDLRYFKWLMAYNSNNLKHLRKALSDAQKATVQVSSIDERHPASDAWASVQMLGTVAIKGNQIYFRIPQEIRPQIADPRRYSLLSMRIQAAFTSAYALELYEHLLTWKDDGFTPWWGLEFFRNLIRVDELKVASDFRYFRRDIIGPAVKQINEVSDLEVELETKRTGRQISHIRFKVTYDHHRISLLGSVAESKDLYFLLTQEFGVSEQHLDEIAQIREKFGEQRILDAVEMVRERVQAGGVKYPGKYLLDAIRNGWKNGSLAKTKKPSAASKEAKKSSIAKNEASTLTMDFFMPVGEELKQRWDEFRTSLGGKLLKNLPIDVADATPRQQRAFEGFLSARPKDAETTHL